MTSSEVGEMLAYDSIDPCGEYREELRHGQMMHLFHLANFKNDGDLLPVDFMNFTKQPEPEETEVERLARIDKEVFGLG
ncbi:hypothetical protein KP003_16640 [Geomonas nitrogeniifigens]|uniref:phage tail assembly protein T n=1 Tax=Geomonas diazotrophica TaxID=2843197 RepID=UPI001C2BBE9D|nr:hypothetical protein [Geomonas nitrogeniifigens]QXE85969.1 hypothetical protein KP003_16640 [Geomonas nitrogeniifigens]